MSNKIRCSAFFAFILSTIPLFLSAQTIFGTIQDANGRAIPSANLLLRQEPGAAVSEFKIVDNGRFQFSLKKEYDTLYLEASSFNFKRSFKKIYDLKKNVQYEFNFVLEEKEPRVLDELVILTRPLPILEKKDTLTYNPDSFKDGTEEKVEDLLSKLPGIDVNAVTGEIQYKGKSVETVLLEGDNLFGYNYTLGTRNIDVGMVEQVEAIDHYIENPLLQAIESSDKVVLNLKLKKGKFDFSGNVEIGAGAFVESKWARTLDFNLLGITKGYKSFATASHNNIGHNPTPFDYFGFSNGTEQMQQPMLWAKKIIPETTFLSQIPDERSNINEQYFANYNAIFRINKTLNIKTNLYYLQDDLYNQEILTTQYRFSDQQLNTQDQTTWNKRPTNKRFETTLQWNTHKNALLEYELKLGAESIQTSSNVLQNNTTNFSTTLDSKNDIQYHKLMYTHKIAAQQALQLSYLNSRNKAPQSLIIDSPEADTLQSVKQQSQFNNNYQLAEMSWLSANSLGKWKVNLGFEQKTTPYQSEVFSFQNNFSYQQKNIYQSTTFDFKKNKIGFQAFYKLKHLNLILEDNNANHWIVEGKVNLRYKTGQHSKMDFFWNRNQKPNSEAYLFPQPVIINSRTTLIGNPGLDLRKIQSFTLNYQLHDVYNLFKLNGKATYASMLGNSYSNNIYGEKNTVTEYFFLKERNEQLGIELDISKFSPALGSTFRLSSALHQLKYKNRVNLSELRNNQHTLFNQALFFKTGWDFPMNFENIFKWQHSLSSSQNQFTNNAFNNTFKAIFKPHKNYHVFLKYEWYLPNTNHANDNYHFWDFSIRYHPTNRKLSWQLFLKNIGQQNFLIETKTNDAFIAENQKSLLPAHAMFKIAFSF